MSVFVTDYSAIPWTVIHDELGHTGTIDPATIVHPKNMDGAENHDFLIVTCPVCQAVSTHPVGGGAGVASGLVAGNVSALAAWNPGLSNIVIEANP